MVPFEMVDDPECRACRAGEAIAVVNIHKLINGRSVFGGPDSTRARPLRIDTVVVDDAHAALVTTEARCAVRIPAAWDACGRLFEMFRGRPGPAKQRHGAGHRNGRSRGRA